MKLSIGVEIELNQEELASINAKRGRMGLQPHTPFGWVENHISDALSIKGIEAVEVKDVRSDKGTS